MPWTRLLRVERGAGGFITEIEEWRDIPGYERMYQASNLGRVKSLPRFIEDRLGRIRKVQGVILKLTLHKFGYQTVQIYKDAKAKNWKVHRLVALTFIPNPENKKTVNHLSGVKLDNHVINLSWATHSENTQHAFDIGLKTVAKGEDNSQSKLTEKQVLEIRELRGKNTEVELGKMFGVESTTISKIHLRKRWKHI